MVKIMINQRLKKLLNEPCVKILLTILVFNILVLTLTGCCGSINVEKECLREVAEKDCEEDGMGLYTLRTSSVKPAYNCLNDDRSRSDARYFTVREEEQCEERAKRAE